MLLSTLILCSSLADEPTPPRVEPVLGLSSKLMFRALSLDRGSSTQRDYQLMSKPIGLHAGVQWYWGRDHGFHTGGLRSTAALGTELMLPTGGFPLSLQLTTGYEWKVRPKVSLFAGGMIAAALDVPSRRYSHGELAIPLTLSTRRVDVTWAPAISFPLQRERRTIFGDPTYRNVAVMVMPLHLSLTFKLGRNRKPQGGQP